MVEILEDVQPTPRVIAVCNKLAQQGYTIALDDFVYRPALDPLIDACHILKIDFLATAPQQIEALAERFSRP